MVDICVPTYLHTEMVQKALAHGLHVLCEKPVSGTSEEAAQAIEAAKKAGKCYMVAHVVRFMKPYMYLKKLVESGELGKPVHFMMRRLSSIPRWSFEDWMRDAKKSGATPIDLSIHDIDFIYDVFGEPKDVSAVYRAMTGKEGFANNDYVTSHLIYDDFSVDITGTWYNCELPFSAEFLAIFENGYAELRGKKLTVNGEEIDLDTPKESEGGTGINITSGSGYTDEIAYFVSCIESGKAPERATPESAQGTVRLVERILANAKRV